ncbi:MAG TPA: uracil-DNA glycosylase [Polyangiaceae bacterium]|nr:uracil-DNA glycosylase [Polyangiaceae bacterium]
MRSLRGHLDELEGSGAWGLPAGRSERPSAVVGDVEPPLPRPAAADAVAPAPAGDAPRLRRAPVASPSDSGSAPSPEAAAVREPTPSSETAAARPPAASALPRVQLPRASLDRLGELAEEARACTRCALHEGRSHSVFARGGGASGIVFVGEGPGEEEDRQGLPFVGPAGQLLDRMIAAMQLDREDVYVCNIVKCRPPKNRKPEPDEMACCMPFLAEQLTLLEPRVIIALGATAVQGLLGTTEGITRLRGQWKLWRGKVPVMPTFHPAYLLRTPQAKREVWKDLQEVLRHLGGDAARPPRP